MSETNTKTRCIIIMIIMMMMITIQKKYQDTVYRIRACIHLSMVCACACVWRVGVRVRALCVCVCVGVCESGWVAVSGCQDFGFRSEHTWFSPPPITTKAPSPGSLPLVLRTCLLRFRLRV